MKFTNLRLVGFKSFVDATDFEIRDGLTGIVGPNGCGKSNLLEALRWVMGATSAKALRGDGMADVIFSGTSMRPARNWAEAVLTLDNADRSAPAEYNDTPMIEVSRRIILRDDATQSVYRINNREVRARDVQLLFADASTGANSPSLVRQGQISELINAKPQNRRRLLEEAAGITGLHTRRHEAELRLRAAEQNLERLNDVAGELESQKQALARQARQAVRYRNISGDIRRAEALAAWLRWREALESQAATSAALAELNELIEETARAAAAASTAQLAAHAAIDPLRLAEAEAAAGLHRLTVAREGLDEELRRAEAERARLSAEIERLEADLVREQNLRADALESVEALDREEAGLAARETSERDRLAEARTRLSAAVEASAAAEAILQERGAEAARLEAERRAVGANIEAAERQLGKLRSQIAALAAERERIAPTPEQAAALEAAKARFEAAEAALVSAEAALVRADDERAAAAAREAAARMPRQRATQALSELKAERDALTRVLAAAKGGADWPSLLEAIEVDPGFESALAAALGDDLSAALDAAAPVHWGGVNLAAPLASLPAGATPLSQVVRAPAEAAARLSMIGVVPQSDGPRLAAMLASGQRLVSKEGDLWRWDGFVARSEARSAAAIRLEQRNRLVRVTADIGAAEERAEAASAEHVAAGDALARLEAVSRDARTVTGEARRAVEAARSRMVETERNVERATNRLSAIADAVAALESDLSEANEARESLCAAHAALPDPSVVTAALGSAREHAARARSEATEARASHNDLAREGEMRARRREEIARERGVWATRRETAAARIREVEDRSALSRRAFSAADAAPHEINARRANLANLLAEAESRRHEAAHALAEAANEAQAADRTARAADAEAASAREARARAEAHLEAAVARLEEAVAAARETCGAEPDALPAIAEIDQDRELPLRDDVERRLERLKRERENLGGVNLRAEEELNEIAGRLEDMAREREDCESAIRKLRAAIGGLNREARQRLIDAFEIVNRNFSTLFMRLFNGGQAELRLIDSEDVLEAGLEIFASPPGKKLASMSLMSGGEQALTATALIFAVFMANPAPVCVLDEVDAPLDDANTERFCRLLHEMAKETETRFIVITHHALTMSRMDRLYGVTMIERGVSQLVSVDLNRAEQLAAAE